MPTDKRIQKINNVLARRQKGIVVLENIYDPHNAAAVLRSMDAFGFQTAYFIHEMIHKYNPAKVGKVSSSSANKWLTLRSFSTSVDCISALRQEGYMILATHLYPDRQINLYSDHSALLEQKTAFVFGNEHMGVSQIMSSGADYHLHIPMQGFVESLNISVCAAIVFSEISRKRHEKGIEEYLLPAEERASIKRSWFEK
jgi:tRNA (guanosine-2'-O-)-methyltransferase